ncbi:MAG: T9SS type A sorting domain-containing protein, partial [Bacteroidota bacterium]
AESPFRIIHPVSGNLVSSYTGTELDVFVRFPNSGSVTEGKISVYASTTGPCSASSRVRNKKVNFGPQLYPLSGPETINRFDRARYILSARNISNLTWSLPSALLLRAELSNYMIEVEAVGDAVGYVTATYLTCGESRSVSQFVRVVPGPLGRGAEEISLDLPTTSLYPNPAVDEVTINSGYLLKQVSVINLVGQTVKTISEVEDYQARLDISGLEPGTYLVVAWDTEGKKIHKLIVE